MARSKNKESAGPAARMVAFVVRHMRQRMGLTQDQLGELIGYTGAAVSAMETLAQPVSDEMLMQLGKALGDDVEFFEGMRLWVRMEKMPKKFDGYLGMEQSAITLLLFANYLVHGLFQTERYARALMTGGFPEKSEERVEELLQARMSRKVLFDRKPQCQIELVVDEAALRRPFGNWEIMREQLEHLAECARRRNVSVFVLPLDAALMGEFAGARGELNIAETYEHDRITYLEVQDESLSSTDPAKVSIYTQRYAKIRTQALGARESLAFIERLAREGS
ncbi:helix-turn-helix transcriptional regulator [Streptomyces sp. NPDC046203]|uniref:helix-turn-helix domain-containing protein n=1 Tax=Streptomyces sp. NPDC046203 TaxID=3154602 RepID=UPI00340E9A12